MFLSQNHTHPRVLSDQPTGNWLFDRLLPAGRSDSKEVSAENTPITSPMHQAETKSTLSPQKPVNLLPEVPMQTSRKLSDKEQRDCDVIGM